MLSIDPAQHINLVTSCSAGISSENIATASSLLSDELKPIFKAKAVLPTEGLAARITKSPGWNPDVIYLILYSLSLPQRQIHHFSEGDSFWL